MNNPLEKESVGEQARDVDSGDRPREGEEPHAPFYATNREAGISTRRASSQTVGVSEHSGIDEYAKWTEGFWFSGHNRPEKESIAIMALGLAGEAGEVVEHLKKLIRDDHINITELKKELGDSIYYWSRICMQFGLLPTEVMRANVAKLVSRRERGKLRGDGDNR